MAMENGTKKILVWSTVIAILGVGGYFGFKYFKKKNDEKALKDEEERLRLLALATQAQGGGSTNQGGGTSPSQLSNPFKSEAEVKAFQDWLDQKHPLWINDNGKWKNLRVGTPTEPNRHVGGKGYGVYGDNTARAYARWGSEYVIVPTNIPSETAPTGNQYAKFQDDIDKIKGNAFLSETQKANLPKNNPTFLKAWADAFRNNKSAFRWAFQIYRSKTGEKVLDYDPMLKAMKTNKAGNVAFAYATPNATSEYLEKGVNVGLVRNYIFNEGFLWFYLPDNGGFNKWGKAIDFTRI
jgi:hypothetical protein